MPASAIRVPLARIRLGRLDDGRLAALAAAGDERAFEALYDRHHRALLGFCRHLLGSREEGEDALQQTFVRAHRALRGSGAPDEVRPWLYAIARNRCLTLLAARRTATVAHEALEPATEGLASEVERRADLRALLGDIGRLPDDQRSALLLAELADLPHAEIATVIGVPAAKVKALVHQARTRLLAERDARETPCALVREQLATARGGALRRGPLRRHLAGCAPCRAYKTAIAEQRTALGLVLPVLPSAGLKEAIFGGIAGGGGGGTAAAVGAAAGGSALTGGGTAGLAAKLAVGAALAGGAGGGAVVVKDIASGPEPAAVAVSAPARADAAPAARRRAVPARVAAGLRDAGERPSSRRGERGEARRTASERAAAKRRRTAAKRERAADRAAAKDRRAAAKDRRAADRAAAKDQRAGAKERRFAGEDPGRAPAALTPGVRPVGTPARPVRPPASSVAPRAAAPRSAAPRVAPGAAPRAPKPRTAKDRAAEPRP